MTILLDNALAAVTPDFSLPPSIFTRNASGLQTEEGLAQRYRRSSESQDDVTFEFTRDPALLHQYIRLYEADCRVMHHVPELREAEENYNRKSHILIARRGNFCIGGARLSVRSPRLTATLPMEIAGFRLEHHFPELGLKQQRYAELSRLVMLPEFRTGDATRQLFWVLYRKIIALDVDMLFAAAPLINVRNYKRNGAVMGMESKIYMNIEVPPYPTCEEIKDYLLGIVINKSVMPADGVAAPERASEEV